jgi:hypothetical protein
MKTLFFRLFVVGALLLCLPSLASAYIDPSTGSYVLQLLLAGLLGALFALKVFWKRTSDIVRSLFRRNRRA